MQHLAHLDWPFFEDRHRRLALELDGWAAATVPGIAAAHDPTDVDGLCRAYARALGDAHWLDIAVARDPAAIDVRSLCLAREILARHAVLAEFAFAVQGLGSMPIVLGGSEAMKARVLPPARAGTTLAAFALSEPEGGSDVAALRTTATRVDTGWRLDGAKTWISNGGIADHYVVFARSGEAPGARGLSAFLVPSDTAGFRYDERITIMAPHPLATLRLENCVVPADHLIGQAGRGFQLAMGVLDRLRPSVGAAALGLARHAIEETLVHVGGRAMFGSVLAEMQLTQARLGEMATELDAAALLVYRAAWAHDRGQERITSEAAMAKMQATEAAQRIIDSAVQLHGGSGVRQGMAVEALYRDVRAMRIYDGATELLKLVIGRHMLAAP